MNADEKYGVLEINLKELLKKKGMNRNQLTHKAEMNWSQVNNYCDNAVTRLDTFVLQKLCTALECRIEDLLTFMPAKEKEE